MNNQITIAALIAIVLIILMATTLIGAIITSTEKENIPTILAIIVGMYGSAVSAIAGFIVGSGKK